MNDTMRIEWLDTLDGRTVTRAYGKGADIFGAAGRMAEINCAHDGDAVFHYRGCGSQHPARAFLLRRVDAVAQDLAA